MTRTGCRGLPSSSINLDIRRPIVYNKDVSEKPTKEALAKAAATVNNHPVFRAFSDEARAAVAYSLAERETAETEFFAKAGAK